MYTKNLIFIFFTLLSLLLHSYPDLTADREALLRLRSTVGGRTRLWNTMAETPCEWAGIKCKKDCVTVLRLSKVSFSDKLPTGIFGKLTELQTLNLRLNALNGDLPADLAGCKNIRNLYLQGNKFSGEIPESLFTLHGLVRLNLANNKLSGDFPLGFNKLTRLRTVYLENNQISGSISKDFDLPLLSQFIVSNNAINGYMLVKLQSFDGNSFLGTSMCGKPLMACSGDISTEEVTRRRKSCPVERLPEL